MPLMLQLPRSPQKLPLKPEGTFVGRQELRNCPERLFVSRHQCKLTPQPGGQQALLLHTGSNPTLVIRSNQEHLLLKPDPTSARGDRLLLSVGDAFSLLATKPDEAFVLVWQDEDQAGPPDSNDNQQQHGDGDQTMQQVPTQELPKQQQPRQQQQQEQQQQQKEQQRPQQQPQQQQRTAGSLPAARPRSAGPAQTGKAAAATPAAAAAAAAPPAAVAPPPGNPVMLILAGLPGSGKSTFAEALAAGSSRAWARINQDSIRGGSGSSRGGNGGSTGGSGGSGSAGKSKRGTREQCVRAAAAALSSGQNVIIDRCNLDAEQRADFCSLGAARGVAVHLLSLSLEARLCVARAAGRTDHEGGVQGPGAARVVNMMAAQAKKAAPPSAAEGLATITRCTSDAQVAAALRRWTAATSGLPKTQQQQQQREAVPQSPAATAAPVAAAAPAAGRDSPAKKRQRTASPEKAPLQQQQQKGGNSSTGAAAGAGAGSSSAAVGSSKNAFSMMMAAAAAKQQQTPARNGSGSTPQKAKQQPKQQQPPAAAAAAAAGRAVPGGGGGWSSELSHIAAAPDRFRSTQSIWHVDERTVGLLDRFPKARCHALLLARQPGLHRASQLTREHLPLLRHMLSVAVGWIQQQQQEAGGQQQQQQQEEEEGAAAAAAEAGAAQLPAVPAGWQLGFHSVPSMATLHLHVISTNFDSVCLKTKKHWNSFTSAFFLHLRDVIHTLEADGRLVVDEAAAEQLLKQPMRCHRCQQQLANIPQLKQHLREH